MLIPGDEREINTSKISCLFFTDWNNNYENSTDIYGGVFSNVTLLNDSAGQHTLFSAQKLPKSITYTFKLSNRIELELYPTYHSYNVTSYFLSLTVSLSGPGKTVQTQVNIEIIRGSGTWESLHSLMQSLFFWFLPWLLLCHRLLRLKKCKVMNL